MNEYRFQSFKLKEVMLKALFTGFCGFLILISLKEVYGAPTTCVGCQLHQSSVTPVSIQDAGLISKSIKCQWATVLSVINGSEVVSVYVYI